MAETLSRGIADCPGLVHTDTRSSALAPGSFLPPRNVFPVGLETNMAAFVYFLIGMPTSWIMSATAAAPGHSLHKQQLEKQNLGHRLGDFPRAYRNKAGGGSCAKNGKATPKLYP